MSLIDEWASNLVQSAWRPADPLMRSWDPLEGEGEEPSAYASGGNPSASLKPGCVRTPELPRTVMCQKVRSHNRDFVRPLKSD
jgi:hypothetical protein